VRNPLLLALCLLGALVLPTGAAGQEADPPSDTPSGTIYEIPVERGRDDAKPLGGDSTERSSRYRSENNFGSSSEVPGVEQGDDDQDAGSAPAGGSGGGSSGGDSGGTGGTGGTGSGAPTAFHDTSGGDEPSSIWLFALLGAILLAAILAGAAAARARHASG
jgi:hypothetical protein